MEDLTWLLIPACFLGFVLFWCLICWLIAWIGGWTTLAREFRTTASPAGPRFYLQSAELNGSRYKGALILGLAETGLSLSVVVFFRTGHPPLLIPWRHLGPFKEEKALWMTGYTTQIQRTDGETVSLTLYDRTLVNAIAQNAAMAAGYLASPAR